MEKERVEKTKTKEEKKLTEEKTAKVRGKKAEKAKKKPGKLHKTSIGMKIYSCIILFLVWLSWGSPFWSLFLLISPSLAQLRRITTNWSTSIWSWSRQRA